MTVVALAAKEEKPLVIISWSDVTTNIISHIMLAFNEIGGEDFPECAIWCVTTVICNWQRCSNFV